jgi:SAM-dependent methyltransferase
MALPLQCPLCKTNSETQQVVTPHVYGDKEKRRAFYHCLTCDVRYQYPALSSEEESKFYNAEFEKFMSGRSGDAGGWLGAESHIKANESTVARRMKYLIPNIPDSSEILEVGCSSGFMLFPLQQLGHICTGIEPSGFFSDYVKGKGVNVYASVEDLITQDADNRFDTIMHFFVLEHIADPISFLKTQLSLLKSGGKIIFEIPNVADALYTVYDIPAFERFYWSIAHPWYFSKASLKYLLDQIDQPYEIQLDQRYDLSNHMIWARDGKPGGMGRFTEQIGYELEELYKKSLIKNGKCDTLIGIITKR